VRSFPDAAFLEFAAARCSTILDPLLFGIIDSVAGPARGSIMSLADFFVNGLASLFMVDERETRQKRDALEQELPAGGEVGTTCS
jgi:MFS-type transporter involved in bile tolerance (Atg22 family)